jgi:hypothetical protein
MALRAPHGWEWAELFYNEVCKSPDYPDSVLDRTGSEKVYCDKPTARVELVRTGRSTVKIEFEHTAELTTFLKLYARRNEGKFALDESVRFIDSVSLCLQANKVGI